MPPHVSRGSASGDDPQWFKDAILYELHVRSFQDSNADGIGDFAGLTRRLPYLQDLGVTAVWILPFYPSPLRDDGYDIADYTGVHRDYGTIDDFRSFLDEAHRLGMRVITELVINHTSDQHAWFQRARTAPAGSAERNFYVWSDSPDRYGEARVIFQDFERSNWSWDPIAGAYYWHRFYSHQPDLNYDNPAVLSAITGVLDFWFGMGVDGMRLDAVPYLVEREGTHSENLRPTHAVVRRLREHVDRAYPGRVFIAEANQWPEDAAAYFGSGDESHMVFHFPLMPRLFMAIRQEDRLPIADILEQTPPPPPGCQWALFLRNHDELTLEMVTEEERLYMYHVYASDHHARINLGIRRRLAPLLGNDRRRIELINALLFSLQGTPIVYYGDEIGMGDNIYLGDRNGVRTPMQWDGSRTAGFSDAGPQQLFLPLVVDDAFHHQAVHVAQQQKNPHSLLSWMKQTIAIRKRYQAFGRGDLRMLDAANTRVLAFVRSWREQRLLVVANLSRFAQHVELALPGLEGLVPVEAFGRTALPRIESTPYALTLGPHGFLWMELTPAAADARTTAVPQLEVDASWEDLLTGRGRGDMEAILPAYVERCTAWNSGGRTVLGVHVADALPIGTCRDRRWLTILDVSFATGEPERYLLPLGARAPERRHRGPAADVVARIVVHTGTERRMELFDAAEDGVLAAAMLEHVGGEGHAPAANTGVDVVMEDGGPPPAAFRRPARQVHRSRRGSNALVAVGDRFVLKLFRQVEAGPNPEIEMRRRLRETGFRHVPALVATLRWHPPGAPSEAASLGVVQEFLRNDGESWGRAVAAAGEYLQRVRRRGRPPEVRSIVPVALWEPPADPGADELFGPYLRVAMRIGRCAADLHRALATRTADAAFAPEPLTVFSRRSAYQRMRRLSASAFELLRSRVPAMDESTRRLAEAALERRADALAVFQGLLERPVSAVRIRCHGNFHLGQVLHVGEDLVIIDYDGEPGRPLYERRLKRSSLQDVATMARSFHYAAHAALERAGLAQDAQALAWMRVWQAQLAETFVQSYADAIGDLLPADPADRRVLFEAYVAERALYELGFELNRGSKWARPVLLDLPCLL